MIAYEAAINGQLCLTPTGDGYKALEEDYALMVQDRFLPGRDWLMNHSVSWVPTGRMQLMLMTGLVVVGCALSARFSPHRPEVPVQASPGLAGLSIEGIQLGEGERHLQARPDAHAQSRSINLGERRQTRESPESFCWDNDPRHDWMAHGKHDLVDWISGIHLELSGRSILRRGQGQKEAVLAINKLRLLSPGTLRKGKFDDVPLAFGSVFWTYSYPGGSLQIQFCGRHGKISNMQLTGAGCSLGGSYHPQVLTKDDCKTWEPAKPGTLEARIQKDLEAALRAATDRSRR